MAKQVPEEERRRPRELHAHGLGRNAIAKELGHSAGPVTKLASEAGRCVDRSAAEVATAAAKAKAARRSVPSTTYVDYVSCGRPMRLSRWR